MPVRSMFAALALTVALPCAALANDTEAALGLGGLLFERNDQIVMESEDLFLSPDRVRVRYQYRNTGAKPVTILVAFPLPDVPLTGVDPDWEGRAYPDWEQYGMKTRVDGVDVQLMRIDIPKLEGKDISARLRTLGWPTRYWEDERFAQTLRTMSADDKSEYVGEGLLTTDGMAAQEVRPAWTVSTSYVRTQTFAPGVPVTVEHSYYPQTGGTVTTGLDRSARDESMAGPEGYEARFCVDQPFLRGYDRQRYRADGSINEAVFPTETWLSYVLKTGANWKGPIKRFKLTVDKQDPRKLVSLCMDGLTKISPTRFEVVKTDFEPAQDIDVLFITMFHDEGGR